MPERPMRAKPQASERHVTARAGRSAGAAFSMTRGLSATPQGAAIARPVRRRARDARPSGRVAGPPRDAGAPEAPVTAREPDCDGDGEDGGDDGGGHVTFSGEARDPQARSLRLRAAVRDIDDPPTSAA